MPGRYCRPPAASGAPGAGAAGRHTARRCRGRCHGDGGRSSGLHHHNTIVEKRERERQRGRIKEEIRNTEIRATVYSQYSSDREETEMEKTSVAAPGLVKVFFFL